MSGEAYIIIKQNEYMKKFRNAGALDAKTAKSLDELKVKRDRIFTKMEDKAIFLPGRVPETFYMDGNAAEEFVTARRRRAFYMMLLVVIVAAVLFLIGRR